MSDRSKIEWTDASWNPVTGCHKVSQGCKHCYAEAITERFHGKGSFTDVRLLEDKLDLPAHWKQPRRVFVNSMSDLFQPEIDFDFVERVWITMNACPQHQFQILTKRPERMEQWMQEWILHRCQPSVKLVLRNVWLGTSVEDRPTWRERLPSLRRTPAWVRFVSVEPLLADLGEIRLGEIDWVIVGGESGPGARPMDPAWALSIREQCREQKVAFFMKQGSQKNWKNFKIFETFPPELQVREYPKTRAGGQL